MHAQRERFLAELDGPRFAGRKGRHFATPAVCGLPAASSRYNSTARSPDAAQRGELGGDGERAAIREHFAREPDFAQGVVDRVFHAHVDHVNAHAGQRGEAVAELRRAARRPGAAGKIGEDVQFLPLELAFLQAAGPPRRWR